DVQAGGQRVDGELLPDRRKRVPVHLRATAEPSRIGFPDGDRAGAGGRRELVDRIKELEEENEDMQERLDGIADLVGEEEEEGDDQGEE
ncbi:MAG: hypothetical protein ACLQB1_34355, partial [Streptosporangiaceae bacterium]